MHHTHNLRQNRPASHRFLFSHVVLLMSVAARLSSILLSIPLAVDQNVAILSCIPEAALLYIFEVVRMVLGFILSFNNSPFSFSSRGSSG